MSSDSHSAETNTEPVEVNRTEVTIESQEIDLAGHLHLPASYEEGNRLPGLVVTGAWMTVKEQMAGRYASELAGRGFAALTFDFRGWGASGGDRRQFEDPESKVEDIASAVDYLQTRPEVDPDRVGGLAVCASAGYLMHAATMDDAIRSVALVAPWLHDSEIVEATYGGEAGIQKLIEMGRKAQAGYRETGEQTFVPAASLEDESAIMFEAPYYTELDRGQIPEWRNEADPAFWEGWLTFDAIEAAPNVTQPFFMVHSESAAIPQGAHRFYEQINAEKGELWLNDVDQFSFYDRDEPVTAAVDAVAAHFRRTLGAGLGAEYDAASSGDYAGRRRMSSTDDEATVQRAADRVEIVAVTTRMLRAVDLRDWDGVRACFTDTVDADYSSIGGVAEELPTAELVSQWEAALGSLDATHHMIASHLVEFDDDGAEATCLANFQAQHVLTEQDGTEVLWLLGGRYTFDLRHTDEGWRIRALTMTAVWDEGDETIFEKAAT